MSVGERPFDPWKFGVGMALFDWGRNSVGEEVHIVHPRLHGIWYEQIECRQCRQTYDNINQRPGRWWSSLVVVLISASHWASSLFTELFPGICKKTNHYRKAVIENTILQFSNGSRWCKVGKGLNLPFRAEKKQRDIKTNRGGGFFKYFLNFHP